MRKTAFRLQVLAACLALGLSVAPAQAQASRTWVSGVGDDANPCSRTAPCKTFAGATSKTAPGGEINCLDPGGFGALTITKTIMIDCSATLAGVLVAGTNGIVVSAGPADVVVLRGLDFDGLGTGINGIVFLAGAALHVEKSTIRNFNSSSGGFGISFTPNAASRLFVTDTTITNNGTGLIGGGINIRPSGTGSARGKITRSSIDGNNNNGITANGSGTSASSVIHVSDTDISSSTNNGLLVTTPSSGGGSMAVMVDRTYVVNNTNGVNATGPKSAAFLANTTIFGSSTGLQNTGGAVTLSYQTNNINGGNSPTDGTPSNNLTRD